MASLTADSTSRRIAVGSWSRRVEALVAEDSGWRATFGIRRGVSLTVQWRDGDEAAWVELFAGGPNQGAAVVLDDGVPSQIAAVAVCGCGDQGCSNASFQFRAAITADALPKFVETIQALPMFKPTLTDLGRAVLWEEPDLHF